MDQFPISQFSEINRVLFLVFDDCKKNDETIRAYQDATREVASAEKAVRKLFDILSKKKNYEK